MLEPLARTSEPQLVGRGPELREIRALLERAAAAAGGTIVFSGGSGVGKSTLLQWAASKASDDGFRTLTGRAYPVEVGIPYSPFADAVVPFVRSLPSETLATLTRGGEAELAHLFPMLGLFGGVDRTDPGGAELKARLLWSFSQFLSRLAARQPLLVILDDLQWADASSLELAHFLARQIGGDRVALLLAYNDSAPDVSAAIGTVEQSLCSIGAARSCHVDAFSHADTLAFVRQTLGSPEEISRDLAGLLYGWTRGNPFFLAETLKSLSDSGSLRSREETWRSVDLKHLGLPASIRDAVLVRSRALTPAARALADVLAVVGTSVEYDALRLLSDLDEARLIDAVDELRRHRVVDERSEGDVIDYDFSHPIVREAIYSEMGIARCRLLHSQLAERLEAYYGTRAMEHAGELAYHYSRSNRRDLTTKAVQYLAAAGGEALRKFSNREAADYLAAALELAPGDTGNAGYPALIEDLARAKQRLGDFTAAASLWRERLDLADRLGDVRASAGAYRRLGAIEYWRADYLAALSLYEKGLTAARDAADPEVEARLRLARGECQMELGRPDEARLEIEAALALAEGLGRNALLARVHLVLLLLHTWTGPPARARHHGSEALRLAEELNEAALLCTVHWGVSVLAGLTGDAAAITRHLQAARSLAEDLRSPIHGLRVAEPTIEFLANTGDWDGAVELAESSIAIARSLNQRSVLARLLVWAALLHLGRGDIARGRSYVDEAWSLSGAARQDRPPDVHTVVPAHIGRAAYLLAIGDFAGAIDIAEAGLAVADRTGYMVWAVHRLLPTLAEGYLFIGDLDGASRIGARLRSDSERLGHPLGLAWADACDALLSWLRGDIEAGIQRLAEAAARLEAIPAIPDAARLRRHFAARLRDHGDREASLRELRNIHDVFVRLGAERELDKTREQIRELGARPPNRETQRGIEGLSAREVEIATLAAGGKTNKGIAKELGISPRTVSTHLSKVFEKLQIDSRVELDASLRRLSP